jgi:CRISPR-associated protein Csy1
MKSDSRIGSRINHERVAAIRLRMMGFFLDKEEKSAKYKNAPAPDSSYVGLSLSKEDLDELFFKINALASKAGGIKIATHITKPINSRVRNASNLLVKPSNMPVRQEVGSHVLRAKFDKDATGSASSMAVFGFLSIEFEGKLLIDWLDEADCDVIYSLSEDGLRSDALYKFFTIPLIQLNAPSSHGELKQIYWPIGSPDQFNDNSKYHIIAPLFPSPLVHHVNSIIESDRFSEPALKARQKRKDGLCSDDTIHDYNNTLVVRVGGSNPVNISYLHLKRHGKNVLLASLPPKWSAKKVEPLLNVESAFFVFEKIRAVYRNVATLKDFLLMDPPVNKATRDLVKSIFSFIIDEFVQFTTSVRRLKQDWLSKSDCMLPSWEKAWFARQQASDDNHDEVAGAFADWLNQKLEPLPIAQAEHTYWKKMAADVLMFETGERS